MSKPTFVGMGPFKVVAAAPFPRTRLVAGRSAGAAGDASEPLSGGRGTAHVNRECGGRLRARRPLDGGERAREDRDGRCGKGAPELGGGRSSATGLRRAGGGKVGETAAGSARCAAYSSLRRVNLPIAAGIVPV